MKELLIEEKAKAYDEAIKYAYYLINERCKKATDGSFHRADLQKMFPELKESEDDRIRKEIIATIHLYYGEPLENEAKEMIAWLEKQGEQKPVVIPKFRIGDIIRWKKADSVEYTIKEINDKGYINTADGIMDISQTDIEFDLVEQKPVWSEEDETMLERVIKFIPQCMTAHGYNEYINWFKSIKGRVQPQSQWKPSDEMMGALNEAINNYANSPNLHENSYLYNLLYNLGMQLKKLREE